MKSLGTTPQGTSSEEQASRWVRGMFGRVAPRYDLLNHLLSMNIDKFWRARTVKELFPVLQRPDAVVLDLCCGTGDLTLGLSHAGQARVFGSDFCHPMLTAATKKQGMRPLFEADALRIPARDSSLDAVTVAFGFRNLTNYPAGLREMLRVLKPGGVVAILEFSTPPNAAFRGLYDFYSRNILPAIGGMISGSRDAYTYLPESVRKFPGAEELATEMTSAGYRNVRFVRMTMGIVALHLGVKT